MKRGTILIFRIYDGTNQRVANIFTQKLYGRTLEPTTAGTPTTNAAYLRRYLTSASSEASS
jgi:hypothetical protein